MVSHVGERLGDHRLGCAAPTQAPNPLRDRIRFQSGCIVTQALAASRLLALRAGP